MKATILSLNQRLSKRDKAIPTWLLSLLIALGAIAIFSPVLQFGFINYDDPDYILENQHVLSGFTKENLTWAFTRFAGEHTYWHPVTWLSHLLDFQLFGLNAPAYHFENVFFHALNAVLLFLLLQRMTGARWRSALVAAIFALHPLQVDTVAWITERKNVLSTMFWFLTLLAYVRYVELKGEQKKKWVAYSSMVFLYALGLMSKPMLVTLPCLLLLLDYWPLKRAESFQIKTIVLLLVEKIPLFILSGLSAAITVRGHEQLGMFFDAVTLPFSSRVANALVSYKLYLTKFFWPTGLAVYYPMPPSWPKVVWVTAMVVIVALLAVAIWNVGRRRYISVGLFWFFGTLVPVIGIMQVGTQVMADRFMYVPIVGVLIVVVWFSGELIRKFGSASTVIAAVCAGAILISLGFATSRQLGYWRDSETLFRHALEVTGDNAIAHNNLASALLARGEINESIEHFQRTIKLAPAFAEAYANLGYALLQLKRYPEAEQQYRAAYRLRPNYQRGEYYFGTVLVNLHKLDEAEQYFLKVIRRQPDMAEAHYQLGFIYIQQHKIADGIRCWREAVRLKPHWKEAVNNLAWTLATTSNDSLRNGKEAFDLAQTLEKITGDKDPDTFDLFAAAAAELGEFDRAINHQHRALELLDGKDKEKAAQFQTRLELYQQRKPYREN